MAETIGTAIADWWFSSEIAAGTVDLVAWAGVSSAAAFTVQSAAIISAYAYVQNQQRKRAAASAQIGREGQLTTVRASEAVRPLVVGRVRMGAPTILYAKVTGDQNQFLHLVLPFAAHEIDAFEDVLFGDESLGAFDDSSTSSGGGGYVTTGKYARGTPVQDTVVVTWPSVGNDVNLPAGIDKIDAVAPYGGPQSVYDDSGRPLGGMIEGTHYQVIPGSPYKLRALKNTWKMPYTDEFGNGFITQTDVDITGTQITVTYTKTNTRPLVRVKKFLGIAAGERDTDLETETGGHWSSAHVGKSVPRLHIRLEFDKDVFGSTGVPNITAVIRGAKPINLVTGVPGWTRNAATITAWFLTRPEGFGIDLADLNSTYAQNAQGVCAESVALPVDGTGVTSQQRYNIDGVIDPSVDALSNLQDLLAAMCGSCVNVGGQWDLRAGADESPIMTLEDADIVQEGMKCVPFKSYTQKYNTIRVLFPDEKKNYQENNTAFYTSSSLLAEDGGKKLPQELHLPYTTNSYAAQRIGRLHMLLDRQELTWEGTVGFRAYKLRGGHTVYCRFTAYGWDTLNGGLGKKFQVLRRELRSDGNIGLVLKEFDATPFSWSVSDPEIPDLTPNTAWPAWWFVPAPVISTVSSSTISYTTTPDGVRVGYCEIRFTSTLSNAISGAKLVCRWKRASDTIFRDEVTYPEVGYVQLKGVGPGDSIVFNMYIVMPSGAQSRIVTGTHTVSTGVPATGRPATTASGNLITNPVFLTTQGWGIQPNGSTDVTFFFQPATTELEQWRIPGGGPINAVFLGLFLTAPANGHEPFVYSDAIPVVGGRRYCFYTKLMPYACQGRMLINWFDASGAYVGGNTTQVVPTADAYARPHIEQLYAFVGEFAHAPANAVSARVIFSRIEMGTYNSWLSILKPFFGEVREDTVQFPPWDSGMPGLISSGQLAPESTVIVRSYNQSSPKPIAALDPLIIQSDQFVADGDWTAAITAFSGFDFVKGAGSGTPYADVIVQVSVDDGVWVYPVDGTENGARCIASNGAEFPTSSAGHVNAFLPRVRHSMAKGHKYRYRMVARVDGGGNFLNTVTSGAYLNLEIMKN